MLCCPAGGCAVGWELKRSMRKISKPKVYAGKVRLESAQEEGAYNSSTITLWESVRWSG